jgi:exopolysaccharide biosynthesis polyprenyl glycosylphosphotransferase
VSTPAIALGEKSESGAKRRGSPTDYARRRRAIVLRTFVLSDCATAVVAYLLALSLRSESVLDRVLGRIAIGMDWSMLLVLAIAFVSFYLFGLYEVEIVVSRPLHLWTLVRANAIAFLVAAALIYTARLPLAFQSRFVVVGTFVIFFMLAACIRVVIGSVLRHRLDALGGRTLVIGRPQRTESLCERLGDVGGPTTVDVLDAEQQGRHIVSGCEAALEESAGKGAAAFGRVFVDVGSVSYEDALRLVAVTHDAGVEVYVVSRLLRTLSSRRLLFDLFEAPIVKVRHSPVTSGRSRSKRALDLVVATAALVVFSPFMAVIAAAIKLSSTGPVFYGQERIGRNGRPFTFYKFRSMYAGNDHTVHAEYVKELINGNGRAYSVGTDREARQVYKLVDDPRVTPVGRFLRKYSLDELPQFWNVLRGDMSLVGPRPALDYEVAHYKEWHAQRLLPLPGISGLWQVQGRSRVTFDEMVFEDVMYGCVQDLAIDGVICLRTIPAALVGHGAV